MVPEALCDGGANTENLGHVLPADQHVPVVELDVHVGLLVQQVVSATSRGQTHQLPEVAVQLVATGGLDERKQTSGLCMGSYHRIGSNQIKRFTETSPKGVLSKSMAFNLGLNVYLFTL